MQIVIFVGDLENTFLKVHQQRYVFTSTFCD